MKRKIKNLGSYALSVSLCIVVSMFIGHNVLSQSCPSKTKTEAKADKFKILYKAAQKGNLEKVKYLMEAEAIDVNQRLKDKQTALTLASYNGHVDIVKFLLDKGADISLANRWGNGAMHDAAMTGQTEVVGLLLEHGADVNQKGQHGYTPLHFACLKQKPGTAKLLIKSRANIHAQDNSGRPPIMLASWNGNADIIQLLVQNGADVNFANEQRNSVLHNIARGGHDEALEILLSNNADPNVSDENGRLPIHFAAMNKHAKSLELLLEKTKDINAQESSIGSSIFHLAAINDDIASAKILFNAGARADIANDHGKLPIDYATKYGYTDMVNLFISKNLAKKDALQRTMENRMLIDQPVNQGEARVVYSGHSGWMIQTANKVLIFDYWARKEPNQPCLANGAFDGQEMQDKEVYVFVSHSHGDHYDPVVHDWGKQVKNIHFIYGFDPNEAWINKENGYKGPEFTRIDDNTTQLVNDVSVTTIKSNDTGQGFLVAADGISIYHPGDHAWFAKEDEEVFKKEVDFIASHVNEVDIAFLPVIGCPARWQKEYIIEGFFYSVNALNPKKTFPMHAFQMEYRLKEFAELAKERNSPADIICVENKGDNYFYSGNTMAIK